MNNRTVRDELLSEYSLSRLITVNQEDANFSLDNPNTLSVLRQLLLDFIADFANWNASTNRLFLKTARDLTREAHEALGGEQGTRPLVVDPFAGGGSIPLEALRVGADTFASDLNPVPVLLNKIVLEYIPKYGVQLASEVCKWGDVIANEVENRLKTYYPIDKDGAVPITYLWARTIKCEGPACGIEVPVLRSLWIDRSSSSPYSYVINKLPNKLDFKVRKNPNRSQILEGTSRRGTVTCPHCGYTTPRKRIEIQAKERGLGQRLLAVVVQTKSGKAYREACDDDLLACKKAEVEINNNIDLHQFVPDLELPYLRSIFNVHVYGITKWSGLFSPRQLLYLTSLVDVLNKQDFTGSNPSQEQALAVRTLLALIIDKAAMFSCNVARWRNDAGHVEGAFAMQALPMVWDWAEINPLSEDTSSLRKILQSCTRVIETVYSANIESGISEIADAACSSLPNDIAALGFTDPPYYDAIPYANLSDFFYVWLKSMLGEYYKDLFYQHEAPKNTEIVQLAERNILYSFKTRSFFEERMRLAMAELRRVTMPNGIMTVVFAHKTTTGWESLLNSVLDAGWVITGSWPIDTELQTRYKAIGTASLASSVHLVCRPRENPDGSLRTDDIGDWRDVLNELPKRIHEWMPHLAHEGVVGADAIFACLGPALEIFSRYSSVEKSNGDKVELKEYLEHVWASVAREALNMIFQGADASGFEEDARLTAIWLWTLRTAITNGNGKKEASEDEDEAETKTKLISGYSLEYDAARMIAQGLGAHLERLDHLVEVKGETATLLSVAARTRYLFGKDATEAPRPQRKKTPQLSFDFTKEIEDVEKDAGVWPGNIAAKPGDTVLDQVHQSMILFGAGRSEAVKRLLVDEGVGQNPLFWRLAQSLLALYPPSSEEKRWIDGVLGRKKGLGL